MLCWCQWDIAKLTALSIHYNNSQWSYLSNATSLGQLLSFHDLTSPTACSMFEHRQHKFLEKANSSGFCITSTSYDTPAARCISANFAASYTHTHQFNGPFSGTTRVGRYQKGKTYLDFTGARDSEWQWHQLGHMQVCTSLQTDNHASTPPLSFLHAGCPSCRPTNSVKAVKAICS